VVNLPISDTLPTANYNISKNLNSVNFSHTSQGADLFYWTFGDKQMSNDNSPVYTYQNSGLLTVTLRASNAAAIMHAISRTIVIESGSVYLPVILNP